MSPLNIVVAFGGVVLLISSVYSAQIATATSDENVASSYMKFKKCISEETSLGDIFQCATLRALKMLNTVNNERIVELGPGVTLTNENAGNHQRSLQDLELPQEQKGRTMKLVYMLAEEAMRFLEGKVISVKLPEGSIARALEEGRGKVKKVVSPIVLGILAKLFTVVPVVLGILSLVSVKALIAAKIAFVLALFILVPYFFGPKPIGSPYGGFGGFGTNYGPGTNTIGGFGTGQYPYNKRSFDAVREKAQNDAYSAQKPEQL